MNRNFLLLCVGIFVFGIVGSAGALTLSAVEGTWTGTTGGLYVNYVDDVSISYGNGLEDQVRWGDPATNDGQSGLGFTGTAPATFDVNDVFEIGQIQHFNNPVWADTAAEEAFLTINMEFTDPVGLIGAFDFTFAIDETSNATGDPVLDADFITFPSSYATETFVISDVEYTLQLLGFGGTADELLDSFSSPEGGSNTTLLWARITTPDPVPEPATILLLGSGIIGLGYRSRRNKKN